MRNPPLLAHTGTGQFTITNATTRAGRAVSYSVFTATGDPVAGTSVTNGIVEMGSVFGEYYLGYSTDSTLQRATKFIRSQITYRTETTTSCSDNCGLAYDCVGSPVPNCQPCWGSGSDGTYCCGGICCGGSRGQTCSTSSRQVKNPVPSGYTEQYGEWTKIDNPVSTQEVETKDTGVFTLPKVEWEEKYYQVVEMPPPHPAKVIDEDTGEPLAEEREFVPAWDYTDIYFIHYDTNGDVVWMKDNINDPECFTIVQKALMTDYEMWISNLPPADEGTYEFVISNPDYELVREEGVV